MQGSFLIGRVRGIELRLHFTFLLVLPIIAISFARVFEGFRASATMTGVAPELIRGSPFLWGTMVALALFASVLLHELAHALFALRKGAKVRDITLLMIGGVASISEPLRDPKQEAVMALVGPLTSFALAVVFFLGHLLLGPTELYSLRFALFYLAALNLTLGLFNLLPAFPMDGGRILRGVLATRMGMVHATQVAATLGKVFAFVFVLASFLTLNFFLMMIAFFVYIGAEAEAGQVLAQSVLGEVRVTDLLQPAPAPMDASATVEDAAARMLRDRQLALLVRRGDEIVGVVTLDDVEKVPPDQRRNILVSGVTRPAPPIPPTANVWDALRLMSEQRLPLVPVLDGLQLVGVLSYDDVVRSLRLYQLQRRPSTAPLFQRERQA
jgi:Zn-dependent protease/CBS domain-containing protein